MFFVFAFISCYYYWWFFLKRCCYCCCCCCWFDLYQLWIIFCFSWSSLIALWIFFIFFLYGDDQFPRLCGSHHLCFSPHMCWWHSLHHLLPNSHLWFVSSTSLKTTSKVFFTICRQDIVASVLGCRNCLVCLASDSLYRLVGEWSIGTSPSVVMVRL